MWVHIDCSFVTDFQYETMQNSSCTLFCPKCEFFSDSFFSEQLNLEDQNRFISSAKDSETRTPSTGTKNNKFVGGLKFSSNEEHAFFASEEHKNMIYGLVKK